MLSPITLKFLEAVKINNNVVKFTKPEGAVDWNVFVN